MSLQLSLKEKAKKRRNALINADVQTEAPYLYVLYLLFMKPRHLSLLFLLPLYADSCFVFKKKKEKKGGAAGETAGQ